MEDEKWTSGANSYTTTSYTGTAQTLIAARFRESLFAQRFSSNGMGLGIEYCGGVRKKHVDPERVELDFGHIYPLMRGYFKIVSHSRVEAQAEEAATKSPRARGALRLVIEND